MNDQGDFQERAERIVNDGPRTVVLRGVRIHAVTQAECVARIISEIRAGRGGVVITPNLYHLSHSVRDDDYRNLLREANLVVADGMPLVWASRLQGTPLPERVAGSDLIWSLTAAAAQAGYSVYFLGGDPGVAEAAAGVLERRHPELKVAGTRCPPVGFESDPALVAETLRALHAARPDIVYVALGSPKQERVIGRWRRELPRAWWLGVGISFSFVCGDVSRAPRWMQKSGLEWLHRLLQEPRRLSRRYLVEGLPFAVRLLGSALAGRLRTPRDGTRGGEAPRR